MVGETAVLVLLVVVVRYFAKPPGMLVMVYDTEAHSFWNMLINSTDSEKGPRMMLVSAHHSDPHPQYNLRAMFRHNRRSTLQFRL